MVGQDWNNMTAPDGRKSFPFHRERSWYRMVKQKKNKKNAVSIVPNKRSVRETLGVT